MKDTYICFIETIGETLAFVPSRKKLTMDDLTHVVDLEEDNSEQIRREFTTWDGKRRVLRWKHPFRNILFLRIRVWYICVHLLDFLWQIR